MHPEDNDSGIDQVAESEQDETGRTLEWLLEQELAEPVDSLFGLTDDHSPGSIELTAREAAVASRPMFGSNASADDLSAYVEEEIVLSGDSSSDIYSGSRPTAERAPGQSAAPGTPVMAIDHRRQPGVARQSDDDRADGLDILGLMDDDDIGSRPLALQRKRKAQQEAERAARAGLPADAAAAIDGAVTGDSAASAGQATPEDSTLPAAQVSAAPESIRDEPPGEDADDNPDRFPAPGLGEFDLEASAPLNLESGEEPGTLTELAENELSAGELGDFDLAGFSLESEETEAQSAPAADPLESELARHEPCPVGDEAMELPEELDLSADFEMSVAEQDSSAETGDTPVLWADEHYDLGDSESEADLEQGIYELRVIEPGAEGALAADAPCAAETGDAGVTASVAGDSEVTGTEDCGQEDGGAIATEASWSVDLGTAARASVPESDGELPAMDSTEAAETTDATAQAAVDSSPGEEADVLSYVSRNAPPADDSEFDRYLLRGEHLSNSRDDFDDLSVESTEGVVSVDPAMDVNLDYHQDFSLPQDFNPQTVATLTAVLAPAMAQLAEAVEARLAQLSLPQDGVALDTMLAIDPLSRRQCSEEGFDTVSAVCTELPEALAALQPEEQEALCVRLVWRATGVCCNDLFQPGFSLPEATGTDALPDHSVLRDGALATGFDFDIGGTPASDEFSLEVDSANDAAGDSAGTGGPADATSSPRDEDWQEDFQQSIGDGGEVRSPGADEPVAAAEPSLAPDPEADDWPDSEDSADDSGLLEVLAEAASQDPPAGDGDEWPAAEQSDTTPHIFSAEDLDDWEADAGSSQESDVEQLLDSIGGFESDIGDICGIAVDEFGGSDTDPDAAPARPAGPGRQAHPQGGDAAAETSSEREAAEGEGDAGDLSWCIPSNIRFSSHVASGSEVFRDFLDAFLEEGAVELEKLEDAIGHWEQDIDSPAGTDTVPRVLHTLKGIAKGVGLQCYGTLIHNFETLLVGLARPAPGGEAGYFRIVNAWLDAAVQGFEHIQTTGSDVTSELPRAEGLVQPVIAENAAEAVDSDSAVHTDHRPAPAPAREKQRDKQLADEGAKVLATQQTIRMSSESVDNLLNLSNQAQQLGVRASQSTFRSKRAGAELLARLSSVRGHITKIADRALANVTARGGHLKGDLDALEMDQYSELQEAASILREAIEDLDDLIHVSSRQTSAAEVLLKQQASVITSLGSAIRDARVMPVSRLMPGLRRIVRTVGADLGKLVDFQVLNESGKLDRDSHVCCQIILEHMVRNALDHGIEKPEQRRELGKPEAGQVTIDVSKEGSDYLIRLSDDGRGMDPDALREAALDRGLDINPAELSDREALRLIFHKGFSTAARLSEISGRGVGMDIVLSELQQIGGEIDIDSTLGKGTTFTVRVPSNVNVNGALLVSAGDAAYAIPLDGLIAIEHVPVTDFYQAISSGEQLRVYDMDCDPAYLATLCSGDKLPDPTSWGKTLPVIIAGSEERFMAIAVDDVTEALELVIRSMGTQFSQVPGVAGGATTSDGQAIVALDLNALVDSIASSEVSAVVFEREKSERLLVLVVDDSRTQRMVATSQFDTLGVETVTAENGMVAIDLLNTTPRLPDVVLLDVEMPVKDGIQTLREIRRSARYKHLPVIMVTSRTGPKHRALAQEAGCNGYMGKPFNFPVLVEQISQLTGFQLQIN